MKRQEDLPPRSLFVGAAPLPPKEVAANRTGGGNLGFRRATSLLPSRSPQSGPMLFPRQRSGCVSNKLSEYNYHVIGSKGGNAFGKSRSDDLSYSWQVKTFPHSSVTGPMGLGHNPGVQTGIFTNAHTTLCPKSGRSPSPRAKSHSGRNTVNASEGSNFRATRDRSDSGFLLKPLSGPQKGRRHETSNKFKESQRVHCPSSLQDGRDSHPEGSPKKGRLDDKSGSEGRILHDPNPRNRQISSPFLRRGSASLSVQLDQEDACRPIHQQPYQWYLSKSQESVSVDMSDLR